MFAILPCRRFTRTPSHWSWPIQARQYALSRFSKGAVGVGRKRLQIQSQTSEKDTSKPPTYRPAIPAVSLVHSPNDTGLTSLLMDRDTLVIERRLEMLNVFIGFEQSNKYTISDLHGEPLGYIAEEPRGFWGTLSRQVFSTHRPFRAVIMDRNGVPLRRPFAWINSRMFVQRLKNQSDSPHEANPILDTFGEVQQIWHLWRRRYDLFLQEQLPATLLSNDGQQHTHDQYYQIGKVDSGFLAWDFQVLNGRGIEIARIERAFRGIGREIFTDTGKYSVHFKASGVQSSLLPDTPEVSPADISQNTFDELSVDARSLLLALAVNIDFDYFSRHSRAGSGGLFHMATWE